MKNTVFCFLYLVCLSSCVSKITSGQGVLFQSESRQEVFDRLVYPFSGKYIKIGCNYYNLKFEKIATIPGAMYCEVDSHGNSIVGINDRIYAEDLSHNVLWSRNLFYVNHQIHQSVLNENLLTIQSSYKPDQQNRLIRYDTLTVIGQNGKIVKSYRFYDYFKKQKSQDILLPNNWTPDAYRDISFEKTHINSFAELYKMRKGKKFLTGYVAYCLLLNKIFVFDHKMKKILKTIDVDSRRIHDVKQLKEGHLIYFLNSFGAEIERRSRVETLNLNTSEIETLYENKSLPYAFEACGSVQVLPDSYLLIAYSYCGLRKKLNPSKHSFLELVNLKTKKSELIELHDNIAGERAYFVDKLPNLDK